jgi:addiction module HigA family antidote
MNDKMPPVHPGEVLAEDFLSPLGISQHKLARETGIPVTRINAIVRGERTITADTALRLGRFFGLAPETWLNLQNHFDLESQRAALGDRLDREVRPHERAG